jgi:hypothetical protein
MDPPREIRSKREEDRKEKLLDAEHRGRDQREAREQSTTVPVAVLDAESEQWSPW